MADPTMHQEPGDDTRVQAGPGPARMPRWVKVFLIIAIVLVVAFIVSRLLGLQHGPGLHTPSGSSGGHIAPVEQEVEQP